MSDGMGREFTYLSSHATNRYFIPNWGRYINLKRLWKGRHQRVQREQFRIQRVLEKPYHKEIDMIIRNAIGCVSHSNWVSFAL